MFIIRPGLSDVKENFNFWTLRYWRKGFKDVLKVYLWGLFCFIWIFAGIALILLRYYSDTVLILSWYYNSISVVSLRYYYDAKSKLNWYRNSIIGFSPLVDKKSAVDLVVSSGKNLKLNIEAKFEDLKGVRKVCL